MRLAMVVLVFLLVSQLGTYLVTKSSNLMELLLARFMMLSVVAMTLVSEATSYLVLSVTSTSCIWQVQVRQPQFFRKIMLVSLAMITLPPGIARSLISSRIRSLSLVQSWAQKALAISRKRQI